MYNRITLLYSRNYRNIVNQLQLNKTFKKIMLMPTWFSAPATVWLNAILFHSHPNLILQQELRYREVHVLQGFPAHLGSHTFDRQANPSPAYLGLAPLAS